MKKRIIKILTSMSNNELLQKVRNGLKKCTFIDFKGRLYEPFNARNRKFEMETIARSESRRFRGLGQIDVSDAQHSVNLARLFIYLGDEPLAAQALLCKASKVYMGELLPSVEDLLPAFKDIEKELIGSIFKHYNLKQDLDCAVGEMSKQLMIDEGLKHLKNAVHFMEMGDGVCSSILKPAKVDLKSWSSEYAYDEFMKTAVQLSLIDDKEKLENKEKAKSKDAA